MKRATMTQKKEQLIDSFDKPKESGLLISVAKMLLPALLLVRHGRTEINIIGDGLRRFKPLRGKRTIICPNHPSWDDADMVFAFSSLVNENFNYLTAWEVLHYHFGYRTWLQHIGCYSVIRGHPDRASYKATRNLLVAGKHKIVIFPEGEISHDSNNLLPVKAGMVQIAFSALQKMEKDGRIEPIFLLPIALKYRFQGDARPALERAMSKLEHTLSMPADDSVPLHLRINLVSQTLVGKLENEYDCQPMAGITFDQHIDRLRSKILSHVAKELNTVLPAQQSHLECAHILQSELYAITYGSRAMKLPTATNWGSKSLGQFSRSRLRSLAKDLHRVVDLVSIYGGFVGPCSSPEHLAEVIDLLEVELLRHRSQKGVKRVSIQVGKAIDLAQFLPLYKSDKAQAEEQALTLYKKEMQAMIGE